MYRDLSLAAAASDDLLGLLALARPGQHRPVLLLAAVHHLLLGGADHPLAAFYPTVTGRPVPPGDPVPAFLDFCARHRDGLARLVATRSTQTNEVNRSVAVAAGWRAATADQPDRPVAVVELGASAGLNLLADRYAVDVGDGRLHGDTGSAVRLRTSLAGAATPDLDRPLPPVVARLGLDLAPVDVRDDDAVRWLEACLWPEQPERFARFASAVEVARADPPVLVAGDLVDDLPGVLAGLPPTAHLVVTHTWALTYVERARRARLVEVLERAAGERPVSWLSAEGPGVTPLVEAPHREGYATLLGLTTWRGGARRTRPLAWCHHHLAWMDWLAEPD